jgi:hypothetical protein
MMVRVEIAMAVTAMVITISAAIATVIMVPIRLRGMGAGQAEAQNTGEKKRFPELHDTEPPSSFIKYGRGGVAKPGREEGRNKAQIRARQCGEARGNPAFCRDSRTLFIKIIALWSEALAKPRPVDKESA